MVSNGSARQLGRRRAWYTATGAIVIAVAVMGCNSGRAQQSAPGAVASMDSQLPPQDRAQLLSMVKQYGGDLPTNFSFTQAQRGAALSLLNAGSVGDENDLAGVYVAVIDGKFTMSNARVPRGASLPTGRYLVAMFTTDGSSTPVDVGVTDVRPDLAKIGTVTTQPLTG